MPADHIHCDRCRAVYAPDLYSECPGCAAAVDVTPRDRVMRAWLDLPVEERRRMLAALEVMM